MRTFSTIVLPLVVLVTISTAVEAQDDARGLNAEERAILEAAVEYVRGGMVESGAMPQDHELIIDPGVAVSGRIVSHAEGAAGSWNRKALGELATSLGGRLGSLAAHHSCEEGSFPPRCILRNADVVLSLGAPEIEGDQGIVVVRIVHRSHAMADSSQAFRVAAVLEVERRDGGWEVVGTKSSEVS